MSYNIEVLDFTPDELSQLKGSTKESNWFVTINTNQRVTSQNDPLVAEFYEVLHVWLAELPEFISTNKGYRTDDTRTIKVKRTIEIGPKRKLLHAHVNIEMKHDSNVKLEFRDIKEFFAESLGLSGIHLDVKHYRGSKLSDQDKILKYMMKDS